MGYPGLMAVNVSAIKKAQGSKRLLFKTSARESNGFSGAVGSLFFGVVIIRAMHVQDCPSSCCWFVRAVRAPGR